MNCKAIIFLVVFYIGVAQSQSNFGKFASQSPSDLSKSLELLENPFVASALVNGNKNNFNPNTDQTENADLFNYFLQHKGSTRGAPTQANVQELLENPFFLSFFNEFNKQYQNIDTEAQSVAPPPPPPITTTTRPFPDFSSFHSPRPTKQQRRPSSVHRLSPTTTEAAPRPQQAFINIDPSTPVVTHNRPQLKNNHQRKSPQHIALPTFPTFPTTTTQNPIFNLFETEEPIKPQFPIVQSRNKPVSKPAKTRDESKYDEDVFRKQAEGAQYMFASDVDDTINGNVHQRQEVRDGLNVKGKYSYSDGFFKRTVHYEADDKGYRVVEEEVEPIGDGPQYDPNGSARVSSYVAGNKVNYEVTKDDFQEKKKNSYGGVPIDDNDEEFFSK